MDAEDVIDVERLLWWWLWWFVTIRQLCKIPDKFSTLNMLMILMTSTSQCHGQRLLPEKKVFMYTVLKQATIKTFLKMSCVGLIKIHVMSVWFYQVLLVEWPGVFWRGIPAECEKSFEWVNLEVAESNIINYYRDIKYRDTHSELSSIQFNTLPDVGPFFSPTTSSSQ